MLMIVTFSFLPYTAHQVPEMFEENFGDTALLNSPDNKSNVTESL